MQDAQEATGVCRKRREGTISGELEETASSPPQACSIPIVLEDYE